MLPSPDAPLGDSLLAARTRPPPNPPFVASIRRNIHAHNFAIRTFRADFERAAADLAIRRETLLPETGVHHHVERLPAERALDGHEFFHAGNLNHVWAKCNCSNGARLCEPQHSYILETHN